MAHGNEQGAGERSSLEDAAARAARGDRAAFGVLVAQTTPRLFRLAARILGDPGDAEDALQEAYMRAFDALNDGRFDGRAGVETWLYRVAANAALDALRARKRRRVRFDVDEPNAQEPADAGDAAARLAARSALRELDAWLAELPPDQRTAIVLKEVEGLSTGEIAEIMKCSPGAVEQRLVRARATLRRRSEEG